MIAATDATPTDRTRPPSRAYWLCQTAGWGGFALYVAGAYLVFSPERRADVTASILLFDSLACLAATHALRQHMHRRHWLDLSLRRFVPRAIAAVAITALTLTAMVAVLDIGLDGSLGLGLDGLAWTLLAFVWAVAGWLLIYWTVQVRRRRERIELELTVLARESQLDALRAQLNPHFLFNCLNSLRGLIAQDPERAMSMVTMLGDLLRYALTSDRRRVVPLAEELAVVDQYLDLERIRFDERLTVERAVEEPALRMAIPPMLIQTLVENAVKHGIATLPHGGTIRIGARVERAHLTITVSNTGTLDGGGRNGFGLRSATERLRLLYDDRALMSLATAGGMTVATLTLPVDGVAE